MNRRGFLRGLIAAPAIVAVANIMPVRSIERFMAATGIAVPEAAIDLMSGGFLVPREFVAEILKLMAERRVLSSGHLIVPRRAA